MHFNNFQFSYSFNTSGIEIYYIVKFKPQEIREYSLNLICSTEREKFLYPVRASGHKPEVMIMKYFDCCFCASFIHSDVAQVLLPILLNTNHCNKSIVVQLLKECRLQTLRCYSAPDIVIVAESKHLLPIEVNLSSCVVR